MDSNTPERFQLQQDVTDVQNGIELEQPVLTDIERGRSPVPRKHFTSQEDKYILKWIEENGPTNWHALALELPDRNTRQVRDRYKNYLCPDIVPREWTKEEDEILISLVLTCGHKWAQFAKIFKSRSDCDIKNHWHKVERLAKRQDYRSPSRDGSDASQVNDTVPSPVVQKE